jgi:hypothetical protein
MYSQAYLYLFSSLFIYVVLSLFISVIMDTYEIVKHGHERGYPATRYRRPLQPAISFSHRQFGYVINISLFSDGWLGWWEMGG